MKTVETLEFIPMMSQESVKKQRKRNSKAMLKKFCQRIFTTKK